MNVKELLERIRIDGSPVKNVSQITVDAENVTVVFEHERDGELFQRVTTVESEAVTFV